MRTIVWITSTLQHLLTQFIKWQRSTHQAMRRVPFGRGIIQTLCYIIVYASRFAGPIGVARLRQNISDLNPVTKIIKVNN